MLHPKIKAVGSLHSQQKASEVKTAAGNARLSESALKRRKHNEPAAGRHRCLERTSRASVCELTQFSAPNRPSTSVPDEVDDARGRPRDPDSRHSVDFHLRSATLHSSQFIQLPLSTTTKAAAASAALPLPFLPPPFPTQPFLLQGGPVLGVNQERIKLHFKGMF